MCIHYELYLHIFAISTGAGFCPFKLIHCATRRKRAWFAVGNGRGGQNFEKVPAMKGHDQWKNWALLQID